jgi:hypothetical protein
MAEYNYLKPNAGQRGSRGVVRKDDGMFVNMPPFPDFGGFYNKSCLHQDNGRLTVDKSPQAKAGKPI